MARKNGISGQTIHGGREIGAGTHAVDAVVQQVVTQLEIVEGVVVAGAREPDEYEAKYEAGGDPKPGATRPEVPAMRPARQADEAGHAFENTRAERRSSLCRNEGLGKRRGSACDECQEATSVGRRRRVSSGSTWARAASAVRP